MELTAVAPFRDLHPGMGQAVAERTYLRRIITEEAQQRLIQTEGKRIKINPSDPSLHAICVALHNTPGFSYELDANAEVRSGCPETRWETWGELAGRVAYGNVTLSTLSRGHIHDEHEQTVERDRLGAAIANGSILMSGRHLQHGDENQLDRPMEVFTNCSTAATSFALFYLLLNGSGVGRCYDDDMMLVNWDNMPTVRVVLRSDHPDFDYSQHTSVRDAMHLYGQGETVHWFKVKDSREGWAEAVEMLEIMAYQKVFRDEMLVLDFSDVRGRNSPIMGMQGRPSSGPVPLMNAFEKIAKIKGAGLKPWKQTLYIDHLLAEPVLVGGARRAARMSTKTWRDPDAVDFVKVKRPIEYAGLTSVDQVMAFRKEYVATHGYQPDAFLWSSNNSLTVDEDFWRRAKLTEDHPDYQSPLSVKAREVLRAASECSYADGTGEPGFINEDRLVKNETGTDAEVFKRGDFIRSDRYRVMDETSLYLARLAKTARRKTNAYIVNPCGEIVLRVLGAFCVISDVVPFFCDTLEDAEAACRLAARSLIRVNLMDSIYAAEVARTNRIGVGLTGVHEFAWKFFKVGFRDLVRPDFEGWLDAKRIDCGSPFFSHADHPSPGIRAAAFWSTLGAMSRSTNHEAIAYSKLLGVEAPHTVTTVKPSGSVSKLFALSEGWHLPAMLRYLRWVQFRNDDPNLDAYRANGYPVRELQTYKGHTIVGFPTVPALTELEGVEEHIVTAAEATMVDQFRWLELGEAFWLEGNDVSSYLTKMPISAPYGNQISYTMKYDPEVVPYPAFVEALTRYQSEVRCCSVMPQDQTGASAYEYLPEEPVSKARFEQVAQEIRRGMAEDIGREHIDCENGACPVSFVEDKNVGATA